MNVIYEFESTWGLRFHLVKQSFEIMIFSHQKLLLSPTLPVYLLSITVCHLSKWNNSCWFEFFFKVLWVFFNIKDIKRHQQLRWMWKNDVIISLLRLLCIIQCIFEMFYSGGSKRRENRTNSCRLANSRTSRRLRRIVRSVILALYNVPFSTAKKITFQSNTPCFCPSKSTAATIPMYRKTNWGWGSGDENVIYSDSATSSPMATDSSFIAYTDNNIEFSIEARLSPG